MNFLALATDYDGTIAHHGAVDSATVDALQQFKDAGGRLLLVTGREIPDLLSVFSETAIFDLVVAENGALLYWPSTRSERLLGTPPPKAFADTLRQKAVNMLSVGRVIVATVELYEGVVRETMKEMRLEAEVILNKGSVMVLPRGVDKGTGLKAALSEFSLDRAAVAAVGDAENDLSLFRAAGFRAAVANALPSVKEASDWVAPSDHGKGVRELIARLMDAGLPAA